MLTGPEAGITRDAISSDFEWRGNRIRLWDTAGIRRKSRVTGKIEKLAVSDALRAIIDRLRAQGKAVIVTTHRLHEAQRLCDRFGLLHEGRLVLEGTLAELQAATARESLVDMFLHSIQGSGADGAKAHGSHATEGGP